MLNEVKGKDLCVLIDNDVSTISIVSRQIRHWVLWD